MSYANTQFILPLSGANGGSSFPDYSRYNRTVTRNGNTQTSTAQSKFYGSSTYFDGSGDTLTFSDLKIPATGDWNFSVWIRPDSISPTIQRTIFGQADSNVNGRLRLMVNTSGAENGVLTLFIGAGTSLVLSSTTSLVAGVWQHVEVDKSSDVYRIFINGALENTSGVYTQSIAQHILGLARYISEPEFVGYMQDARLTLESRHTASFTPPGKLIGTLSNQGTGGEPVKDDTGSAAARTMIVVPRIYGSTPPPRIWQDVSDGSGNFNLSVPSSAEFSDIDGYSVIALDDSAGTDYNDLVFGKVETA